MKRFVAGVVIAVLGLVATPISNAQAQGQGTRASDLVIPISGTGGGGTFAGNFTLQRFVRSGNAVSAIGTITGTLTSAGGQATSIVRTVSFPVDITQATCDILHLDLGPLSLDLLGLQIDLSRIVLDITAEPGAGNLLGNLLCAVARLLDNPSGLAQLLNRILGALG